MALKEYRVLLHGRTQTTAMYDEDSARKLGLTDADLVSATVKGRASRRTNGVRPKDTRVKAGTAANKAAEPPVNKSVAAKAKEAAGLEETPDPADEDLDADEQDLAATEPDPTGRGF